MTQEEIFKSHMDKFRNGLFRASLDYYLETGIVSGSLLLTAREMFKSTETARSHSSETIKKVLDSITPEQQEVTEHKMIEEIEKETYNRAIDEFLKEAIKETCVASEKCITTTEVLLIDVANKLKK